MWILFAVGALLCQGVEESIDKIAIVGDKAVDTFAASFWRNVIFWLWFVIVGISGLLGSLTFFISVPIVLMAALFMGSGIFYTYLLKRIEVTAAAALNYAVPFLYLFIDLVILRLSLTPLQVAGVLLLTAGGLLFVTQHPKRFQLKKEFTPKIFGIFAYSFVVSGVQYYGFKYYFETHAMNEVSYYFNIWLVMTALFLLVIAARNQWETLWRAFRENRYGPKMIVSKGFDAASSYLWLHALTLASVSQVQSTSALYPLILLGIVYVMQNIFRLNAEEEFSKERLVFKLAAVVLLCIGGFLAQ